MRSFIRPTPLTLLMPILILAGCSHTIPATDRKPQPPPQLGKTPPTIAPLNASGKQAQAPESMLPVTLTTDLTPVQRTIQAAVPERFTDEDQPRTTARERLPLAVCPRRRTSSTDPGWIGEVSGGLPGRDRIHRDTRLPARPSLSRA